ncbi:DEAD/DEAH box helicase (plasmid) [Telmatobacter bradus]|uniref:DEAD/DEAH box helicase n=1 Tax=Telmatobacter bradus TaxID=474953 RepID=UPI003B42A692
MDPAQLAPVLTPHGHLSLAEEEGATPLDAQLVQRLRESFTRGTGHGLLQLGAGEVGTALPAVFSYWREFAARYVTTLCAHRDAHSDTAADPHHMSPVAPPADAELEGLAMVAPLMTGAEYLTADVLRALWLETDKALQAEFTEASSGVPEFGIQAFLRQRNPAWNLVGRVCFHLAENRGDDESPFAFLATYTARLSAHSKAQHLPLGQALREYEGSADRLLSLLLPVQRAAESCAWLKEMVDTGDIFHPLRWTPADAAQFLRDCPQLEQAGIVIRMPATWSAHRPSRAKVSAKVGSSVPSLLGQDALLDFRMEVTLDGETLTAAEIRKLLAGTEALALVRGRWVEVDREQLSRVMDRFSAAERAAARDGLNFGEAMRLLAGAQIEPGDVAAEVEADWAQVTAGDWLAETLKALRRPEALEAIDPGTALQGTLRPYQQVGVRWLYLLAKLGLGACLADDMGLGKTIQVLSLLLVLQQQSSGRPSLLVVPASLLANWASELERFAPSLKVKIAHTSAASSEELKNMQAEALTGVDVVITSYGSLLRLPWLTETNWRLAVLDEAQTIKNPNSKQTRAAKKLKAGSRFALTGTPVENRLGDLWSIFDFINPGLLGSPKEFSKYTKRLAERKHNPYGPLRELVRPYILRRLKTDRAVIADLPDKTEVKAFCQLSRKQAALYEQTVTALAEQLNSAEGMQRKGLVLSFLMRFKQICNHPSQWLGDDAWSEADSGKWARLRDIAEVIAARQEKVLVFTQFREMTAPLASFLGSIFGRPGLVLHGETPVKNRKELVRRFQEDETVGFFVLSLKAGGTGLNLTSASHVIHFDRWWNPAVENQATDRAFRIGQKKNVLVHKFVCKGTVEEKIDQMIESKRQVAEDMLEGDSGLLLTEMKDDELLRMVALDLSAALKET